MQLRPIIVAACVVLSGVVTVQAQLKSGPAVDAEVTGFKVHALTGELSEKDKDKDVDDTVESAPPPPLSTSSSSSSFANSFPSFQKTLLFRKYQ